MIIINCASYCWYTRDSVIFLIHMKYVVFYKCRRIKILISNWPRKLKFSQFLQAWKKCQFLLTFLTKVTRWLRSTSNFYAVIASWNLFTLTAEADRVLCQLVMFLTFSTGCTKWNSAAIRSLLLFMASLFIGFLVESKSEIRFRMASFSFSPCLMRKRVAKSEAILALLDTFQELHLEW